MARSTYQTTSQAPHAAERRRNLEQTRKAGVLRRPTSSNRIATTEHAILPLELRRTEGNPWISLVRSRTTENRLGKRLDRHPTTPYRPSSPRRSSSPLPPSIRPTQTSPR